MAENRVHWLGSWVVLLCLQGTVAGAQAPRVVNGEGKPVEGARITVRRPVEGTSLLQRLAPPLVDARTGADGRVSVPWPVLEELLVVIDHPSFGPLVATKPAPENVFALPTGHTWVGRVEVEGGGPLEKGEICARWHEQRPHWSTTLRWERCAEISRQGSFSLQGLGGKAEVVARARGLLPAAATWEPDEAPALRLTRGSLLHGHVIGGRMPLEGARLGVGDVRGETVADGGFEIPVRRLPVTLTVQAEGFHTHTLEVDDEAAAEELRIQLLPREQVMGVAVGEQSLPLEQVELWAVRLLGDGSWREHRHRLDAHEGAFRLELPGPGRYRLTLGAPKARSVDLGELDIAAGEQRDLGVVALSPGSVVRVVFLEPTEGRPVAGVAAELLPLGTQLLTALRRESLRRAVTDETGVLELSGLDGGRFDLRASHRDFATASVRFNLERDETLDLGELTLERGAWLKARVVDRQGLPRPGLSVRLFDPEQASLVPLIERISDADGRIDGPALASGRYRIQVAGERLLLAQEILVPTGEAVFELELVAAGVELSGVIVRDGEPVDGGFLTLRSALDPGAQRGKVLLSGPAHAIQSFGQEATAMTADVAKDGGFRVQDAPPGTLWVRYLAATGDRVVRQIFVPDQPQYHTAVEVGGLNLRGRVVEMEDPVGISGASVRILGAGGKEVASLRTDEGGSFHAGGLEPGDYSIEAGAPGFGTGVWPLKLGAGTPPLTLPLEPGGGASLAIDLRRADGTPAGAVMVTLLNAAGRSVRSLMTDASGHRLYENLAAGEYFVVWSDPVTGTGISPSLRLEARERVSLDRVLPPGGAVEITCESGICGGSSIDHLALYTPSGVEIAPYLSGIAAALRFSPQGTLHLGRLSPGQYLLRLWSGGAQREVAFRVASEVEVVALP